MRLLPIFFLTTSAALTSALQTPQPSGTPPQQAGRTETGLEGRNLSPDAKRTDAFLATWLMMDNRNEVALAQLAQQKATDPEVKQYAQRLIEEHGQFIQKLQPFASNVGVLPAGMGHEGQPAKTDKPDREGQNDKPGENQPRDNPSRDSNDEPGQGERSEQPSKPSQGQGQGQGHASSQGHPGEFDHLGLIRDLGDQCLRTSRKELEQKTGADFDRCYMGMALGQHLRSNDLLTVFQQRASAPLKTVMSEGQRTVAAHLQVAKDFTQKMEKAVASRDRGER